MYRIDSENNITAHAAPPTGADLSQSFSTGKELAKPHRGVPRIAASRCLQRRFLHVARCRSSPRWRA
jgi:hypothetical protein